MRSPFFLTCTLLLSLHLPRAAYAWGDEGHEVVAVIADHFLTPGVKAKVHAMLDMDTESLTEHDIAHAATWADKFRDSDRNTTKQRYNQTHLWHFVDIEITGPKAGDEDAACFREPALLPGVAASEGPARDCSFNKVDQFAGELANPATPPAEKLLALKFLLHFVGDIHQPLHDADNHNTGGNAIRVKADGMHAGNLHHYWDTEFVHALNRNASAADVSPLSSQLIAGISPQDAKAWSRGNARAWAKESFVQIQSDPYMSLPKGELKQTHPLDVAYVKAATKTVAEQLQKAGVRLAYILNTELK